jgi:hypothetical protein
MGWPGLFADRGPLSAAARRTQPALLLGGVGYLLSMVTSTILMNELFDQARAGELFDLSGSSEVELSEAANLASLLSNVAQLAILAAGVLFLVWFWKAAHFSQAMGLRQRRAMGWVIAGWLVPIVNFWFPYQATRDLLPPGDPATVGLVKRWWALWIAMSVSGFFIVGGAAIMPAAAWGVAVVAAVLTIGATVTAQQVVEAIDAAQQDYLDRLSRGDVLPPPPVS